MLYTLISRTSSLCLADQTAQGVELGLYQAALVCHYLHHLGGFVGDVEDADAVGIELNRARIDLCTDQLRCDLVCTSQCSLKYQEVAGIDRGIAVKPCPVLDILQSALDCIRTEFYARL